MYYLCVFFRLFFQGPYCFLDEILSRYCVMERLKVLLDLVLVEHTIATIFLCALRNPMPTTDGAMTAAFPIESWAIKWLIKKRWPLFINPNLPNNLAMLTPLLPQIHLLYSALVPPDVEKRYLLAYKVFVC